MILKSLTVRHWGCLITGVYLDDFSAGANIIYGPNESGKSTLVGALTRGLFDKHKMQSIEFQAVQPWGTSLAPEVVIEFEQGDKQHRVEKRFLSSQRCELWHRVNGEWEPLADGDNADDHLLEILESDRPGRGATQPKHWGLAQLLWLPQGQVWLPEDGLNEKSRNRLQSILGDILITPTFHAVESRIHTLYDEFFTHARAELKARSEPKELAEKLEKARETFSEVEQRWDALDDLNRDILRLKEEYGKAEGSLKQKSLESKRVCEKRSFLHRYK